MSNTKFKLLASFVNTSDYGIYTKYSQEILMSSPLCHRLQNGFSDFLVSYISAQNGPKKRAPSNPEVFLLPHQADDAGG